MTKQAFVWTLTTHTKLATLCISEDAPLTTKSHYVNTYPSTFKTASYNFLGPGTTTEIYSGIVKTVPLHSKNPAQHFQDFTGNIFTGHFTGERKTQVCVHVGGGGHDEGPTHKEVQFWSTCYHLKKASQVLILITRDSGTRNKTEWSSKMGVLPSPILTYS